MCPSPSSLGGSSCQHHPKTPPAPAPPLPHPSQLPQKLLLLTPWLPVRIPGLEKSQGLLELKLSALLSPNPLQNPSKNPLHSSLTVPPPKKFHWGKIPLQSQQLSCSCSFFFPREIIPSAIPADFCHISGPCSPKKHFPTGLSAPLPPSPACVSPDGCNPPGFVAFVPSCPIPPQVSPGDPLNPFSSRPTTPSFLLLESQGAAQPCHSPGGSCSFP